MGSLPPWLHPYLMVTSLSTYFDRIGYTGNASVSLETLQTLNLHHTQAIAYENLNPFLGWPVPLDTASLQEKLVNSRRGGYCYEQNLFFKHVLETIGFRVTGLAARVVWNMTPDVVLPRTHMLMRVEARGESFIADVGFGSLTLTAPLRLQLETAQHTPHGAFRLVREVEEFVLEAELGHEWKQLYKFTLHEQLQPDYEMANYYVSCHPKSRFVNGLMAARPAENRRYALSNNEFTVRFMNGQTERRVLGTAAEIRDVLEGPMGLKLPSTRDLDLRLQQLIELCTL